MNIKKGKIKEKRNETMQEFIKKHKMGIIVTISAIIMAIGLSFAWLQITLRGTKELTILTAGSLELELDDTMAGGISFTEAVPVSNEEGLSQEGYTFTLENKGNVTSDYTIYLDDLDLAEGQNRMKDSFIKYQLTKDGSEVDLQLLDQTGTAPNRILESGTIAPKSKYTYVLKMWIDESATNEVMETIFKGQLRIDAMQEVGKSLYAEIAKSSVLDNIQSEFVTATTGIDFGSISSDTNGKGVYTFSSTKDDTFPVHYYRGDVKNNNVKFAGFCWKIVRTTETGGVKLIYNGSPDSEGQCNHTTGDFTQIKESQFSKDSASMESVGYMVNNNTTDSTIKSVIDNWYQEKMMSYTKKLEDTIWCNDRSVVKKESGYTYFGTNDRVYTTHIPSLDCINDADKFTVKDTNGNGLLTYPVALLTGDEVILAGGKGNSINSNYYLYTNENWWTLSPSHFGDKITSYYFLSSSSNFYSSFVDSSYGVRPSISLAPNTKFISGNGSYNRPYEIK